MKVQEIVDYAQQNGWQTWVEDEEPETVHMLKVSSSNLWHERSISVLTSGRCLIARKTTTFEHAAEDPAVYDAMAEA